MTNSTTGISGYGTNSYIIGNLRRTVGASGSYDFPIGTSTNYQAINILLVSQTGISNLVAFFTSTAPTPPAGIVVSGVAVNNMLNSGFWTVTPNATITGGSYTATTQMKRYTTTGLNSNTKYYLLKRHDASSAWAATGTQQLVTGQTIGNPLQAGASLLTTWSDFGTGYGGGSTLPITLSAFSVNLVNNEYADLNWTTSAELNNEYFDVERSADGKNFEAIGRVEGHGTSLVRVDYNFHDDAPLEGTSYYRLKQHDFDGPTSYSPIESINNLKLELTDADITLFPYPATTEINIAVQFKKDYTSNMEVVDMSGRTVYKESKDYFEGNNQFKVSLTDLPSGIYFIKISDGGDLPILKKFIKN